MKFTPCRHFNSLLLTVVFTLAGIISSNAQQTKQSAIINMVFTSDAHYGITRHAFRGDTGVAGVRVNAAMVRQINTLPKLQLPGDSGVNSSRYIKSIDYLMQTGDISNRMDAPVQSAATSWAQFYRGYLRGLKVKANNGRPIQVLMVPGNHDATNAIGSYKPMRPLTDPTTMVHIYNLMMKPAKPITNTTYDFVKNKINYSRNIGGVHFVFITIWPDSVQRVWMEKDLAKVKPQMPVIIFAHDPPVGDVKHFSNPAGGNVTTPGNQYEFLLSEKYKESKVPEKDKTNIEQLGWVKFLKAHPNVKAYFHGHSNWNEFYTYKGPDNDVNLPVFRVDSPMKGKLSSKDETKLSFQLISLDASTQRLTVRECLWNTHPEMADQPIVFGQTKSISLKVN
jgi:hypothetical protein